MTEQWPASCAVAVRHSIGNARNQRQRFLSQGFPTFGRIKSGMNKNQGKQIRASNRVNRNSKQKKTYRPIQKPLRRTGEKVKRRRHFFRRVLVRRLLYIEIHVHQLFYIKLKYFTIRVYKIYI